MNNGLHKKPPRSATHNYPTDEARRSHWDLLVPFLWIDIIIIMITTTAAATRNGEWVDNEVE